MELIVYVDFASAQARLALNPTRQLAEETGIALDWRPFSRKPRPGGHARRGAADTGSRGARHSRVRTGYRRREEAFYAEQQGIPLVYPGREQEAFTANAALAWLGQEHGPLSGRTDAYVLFVFEQVWSGVMDPGNIQAVREAVVNAGSGVEGFDRWLTQHAEAELENHRRRAREWGVVDVPGYVADGEPFVGRANLPIVRSLLAS